jgi:PAS domain S-box-containing protein
MDDAEASDVGEVDLDALFGLENLFNLSVDLLCIGTVDGHLKRVNPAFERTLGHTAEELLARPFYEFLHPEDLERTRVAMAALGRGEEVHHFENRFICRDGSTRWLQWNARPGPEAGYVAAAARDVTDSRARTEQAALRRVATLVAHGAAPTEVFTAVAAEVASLLRSDYSRIGRYELDGTVTHLAASPSSFPPRPGARLPLDRDPLASVVRRSGQPAWISYDDFPESIAASARRLGVASGVGTPILVEDRIWGVMAAGWAQPREASIETEERIAEFTELVATAIANAESRAELIASRARVVAASDATRQRIERNLHDGAQQRLVTLALKLRTLSSVVPTELEQQYADVASGLDDVLDELRELSRGIHPAMLSKGGLGPALKALARRSPLPVEVDVRLPVRPPERIEVAAYYVVAEAVTNVVKHGQASVVVVVVEAVNGDVQLSVADDGVGGADPTRGSGLVGLRDRVEALGGSISLSSPPDEGTSIVVHIPVTFD